MTITTTMTSGHNHSETDDDDELSLFQDARQEEEEEEDESTIDDYDDDYDDYEDEFEKDENILQPPIPLLPKVSSSLSSSSLSSSSSRKPLFAEYYEQEEKEHLINTNKKILNDTTTRRQRSVVQVSTSSPSSSPRIIEQTNESSFNKNQKQNNSIPNDIDQDDQEMVIVVAAVAAQQRRNQQLQQQQQVVAAVEKKTKKKSSAIPTRLSMIKTHNVGHHHDGTDHTDLSSLTTNETTETITPVADNTTSSSTQKNHQDQLFFPHHEEEEDSNSDNSTKSISDSLQTPPPTNTGTPSVSSSSSSSKPSPSSFMLWSSYRAGQTPGIRRKVDNDNYNDDYEYDDNQDERHQSPSFLSYLAGQTPGKTTTNRRRRLQQQQHQQTLLENDNVVDEELGNRIQYSSTVQQQQQQHKNMMATTTSSQLSSSSWEFDDDDGWYCNYGITHYIFVGLFLISGIVVGIILIYQGQQQLKQEQHASSSSTTTTTSPNPTTLSPTTSPLLVDHTNDKEEWIPLGEDWIEYYLDSTNPIMGTGSHLGHAVALSANGYIVAGGAPRAMTSSVDVLEETRQQQQHRTGTVQVSAWNVNTNSWQPRGSLLPILPGGGTSSITSSSISRAAGDAFGSSVALNDEGTILAIGIPGYDHILSWTSSTTSTTSATTSTTTNLVEEEEVDDFSITTYTTIDNVGAVQIFQWNNLQQDWIPLGLIVIPGEDEEITTSTSSTRTTTATSDGFIPGNLVAHSQFGSSVALSANGDIVAIGASRFWGSNSKEGDGNDPAPFLHLGTVPLAGYVQVYQLVSSSSSSSSSVWIPLGREIRGVSSYTSSTHNDDGSSSSSAAEECGATLDISDTGRILAIGCPRYHDNRGRVRIYSYSSTTGDWEILGQDLGLVGGDTPDEYWGSTLALARNGKQIVMGSARGQVKTFVLDDDKDNNSPQWMLLGDTQNVVPSQPQQESSTSSTSTTTNNVLVRGSLAIASNTNDNETNINETPFLLWVGSYYSYVQSQVPGLLTGRRYIPVPGAADEEEEGGSKEWTTLGQEMLQGDTNGDHFGISCDLSRNGKILAVGVEQGGSNGLIQVYQLQRRQRRRR